MILSGIRCAGAQTVCKTLFIGSIPIAASNKDHKSGVIHEQWHPKPAGHLELQRFLHWENAAAEQSVVLQKQHCLEPLPQMITLSLTPTSPISKGPETEALVIIAAALIEVHLCDV